MKTQDIKNMAAAMQQVAENQKAAIAKKLAKSAAASEKGKAAVTLPKAPWDKKKEAVEEAHDGEMPSKAHIMKMCKDGATEAEICKMHPNCDQDELKAMIKDCKGSKYEMSSKEKMKRGLYNEQTFVIPEDVPVDERDMFMAKAAAAHKAGKSHFSMPNGKKHPVTMQKDTAKAVNSSTNEGIYAMKKAGNAKADAEADERKKMKSEEMDETKPCPKCDGSMENHSPDCPMSKEGNGNDDKIAKANPKQEKAKVAMEGTVYARILEKSHTAGATKPEGMNDKSKSSKGAMDMLNTPKEIDDTEEKGHKDAADAGRKGPRAKARPNDNMKGDKAIVNPIKK